MVATTVVAVIVLIAGIIIGLPVLVALSVIFVAVQLLMIGAKVAVERNDRRLSARLAERLASRDEEG
ncbi:MAG: hypothetical protein ISR43_04775 [Acidimicrobiia bacterium]|nr:hypothetical protein [Actinomycetota bacterium]MBL6923964.1 hypothetical protein [Acidimicrobiia bacterium]MBL6926525.1 hypothetical protein [Acidimicrobiia bacterium]